MPPQLRALIPGVFGAVFGHSDGPEQAQVVRRQGHFFCGHARLDGFVHGLGDCSHRLELGGIHDL